MVEWKVGELILGEYQIEKELGRGGMGCVWLVKSNSTGRRFAVKQTLLKEDKHRKAFLAELQTWIDLPEHPNIVPYRFFRTVGDEIVIFADYIEGGSLADWIAKGKLTGLEQILDVAIQFAWGLHAIHERGLIHQDVKPGNVLMTIEGVPMVTDFGLARARLRAADGAPVSPALPPGQQSVLVSSSGMTPAYASPEQRNGKPLSRKTDIWSWGVSVLDMFMGGVSCPHGGHIAAEVMEGFVENGQTEDGLPQMPVEVAEVLRRCFLQNPTGRWSLLEEAADALSHTLAIQGHQYRRYKPRPGPLPALVASPTREGKHGASWIDPHVWLHRARKLAGQSSPIQDSSESGGAFGSKGSAIKDLAVYEEAVSIYQRSKRCSELSVACSLAELFEHKAIIHQHLDDWSGAITCHDRAIELWHNWIALPAFDGHGDLAGAYINKAIVQMTQLKWDDGISTIMQALTILGERRKHKQHPGSEDDFASAHLNMGLALWNTHRNTEALQSFDQAISVWERLYSDKPSPRFLDRLAAAHGNRALVMQAMGRHDDALRGYDSAIERWKRLERDTGQDVADALANAYLNKAVLLMSMPAHTNEASNLLQQAVSAFEELVCGRGQHVFAEGLANAYDHAATAATRSHDPSDAIAKRQKAIETLESLVEKEGRTDLLTRLARCCSDHATCLHDQRQYATALGFHAKAIDILTNAAPSVTDDLAVALMRRGNTLREMQRPKEALSDYDVAQSHLEHDASRATGNGAVLGTLLLNKATVLEGLGEHHSVVATCDRAIQVLQSQREGICPPSTTASLLCAYGKKATALGALGDTEGEMEWLKQTVEAAQNVSSVADNPELLEMLGTAGANLGSLYGQRGQFNEAVKYLRQGIGAYDLAYEKHDQDHLGANYALAKGMLAFTLLNCGKREEIAVAAGEAMLALLTEYRRSKRQDIRHMLQGLCSAVKADQWFKKQVEEQE